MRKSNSILEVLAWKHRVKISCDTRHVVVAKPPTMILGHWRVIVQYCNICVDKAKKVFFGKKINLNLNHGPGRPEKMGTQRELLHNTVQFFYLNKIFTVYRSDRFSIFI